MSLKPITLWAHNSGPDAWKCSCHRGSEHRYHFAVWFTIYHTKKLPGAIDRYVSEINRVSSVPDGVLQQKAFLVDNKLSYTDASFVMWYAIMSLFADMVNLEKDYPGVHA
ncbi:hypothetical protein NW762_013418 [Fusarium torreyae]|uniref:GST C-terminal domain-containing protein n=1 Tax=Fusarium torreyae TaxID=1237075 RepID=A0A9W8V7T3_9HYPO|nr:hypothetical protein NW762_013418 [Fusarium torreyae]